MCNEQLKLQKKRRSGSMRQEICWCTRLRAAAVIGRIGSPLAKPMASFHFGCFIFVVSIKRLWRWSDLDYTQIHLRYVFMRMVASSVRCVWLPMFARIHTQYSEHGVLSCSCWWKTNRMTRDFVIAVACIELNRIEHLCIAILQICVFVYE